MVLTSHDQLGNTGRKSAFRYLHEEKLFLIEPGAGRTKGKSGAALRDIGKSRACDHVWLCSSCCRDMTIYIDDEDKVRVVRKPHGSWTRVGSFRSRIHSWR